ncbi:Tol-Pal system protein TolQ [hydrothermal vent metagenome]|uniref:Tol-Pal system protein TolQ n=1 Tax=hydrothermal vent metagenome TaxID=652676 RepID=A0A3B0TLD9_9ZZZZ
METEVAAVALGGDFSLWSLFLRADPVVKSVMGILIIASIWSWAVMIDKSLAFGRLKRKAVRFEAQFWSGKPLDDLFRKTRDKADHPMARVFTAAMEEWARSKNVGRSDVLVIGARDRIDKVLNVTVSRELEKAEGNLSVLATVGSTAPFVGLLGTVWGIMNAFQAIAITENTNIAVVAPGIAEALFATALGLVAAIPAVVGYNRYSAALNSYAVRLQGFADEFSAILSRQLDDRSK